MRALGLLLLSSFVSVAAAQSPATSLPPIATPHLIIRTSAELAPSTPGAKVRNQALLHVDITPKPRMHIYAPGEKDAQPVSVKLDAAHGRQPFAPRFPPSETYFFKALQITQLVYSKPFRVTQPMTLPDGPSTGGLTFAGTLSYQACDDAVCYLPKTLAITWTVSREYGR